MAAFHARDLPKARDLFAAASEGPEREIALAARNHRQMCEQRLARQAPKLETADDFYHYGVALTNQRQLEEGLSHLRRAVEMEPAGHSHYALSVVYALLRRFEQSAQHLREAIRLDPANRVTARNDPDFSDYLQEPAIKAVLQGAVMQGERKA
jgi:Flp pilus assembly protein TadD